MDSDGYHLIPIDGWADRIEARAFALNLHLLCGSLSWDEAQELEALHVQLELNRRQEYQAEYGHGG